MSIRDELVSIIGYTAEVCEPNAKPVKGFYTDRHLNPILNELVDYVEAKEHVARINEQREIEQAFHRGGGTTFEGYLYNLAYLRGYEDAFKHLEGRVPLSETTQELIDQLSRLADEYGLAGVIGTAMQMRYVPASRIAESDTFLREMEDTNDSPSRPHIC